MRRNKTLFAVALMSLAMALVSCGDGGTTVKSDNATYSVRKLFTIDGVTVYRFCDMGDVVYFTNGNSVVQSSHTGGSDGTEKVTRQTLCNKNNGDDKD